MELVLALCLVASGAAVGMVFILLVVVADQSKGKS